MALDAGMKGIICSPKDLTMLNKTLDFSKLFKVTPSVRPPWANHNNQVRFMTPQLAILNGADYLVIGRPITNPPEGMTRVEAAQRIAFDIANVLRF